jgi:NitT/TauT family transport system substrate-binding protein
VANEWQLVTTLEVVTSADLDGKRLAFHSEGAAGTAMTNAYLEASCPSASPHVLIIPGSENRAAALVAGEIDASPLALADVVLLQRQAPGRFHILASFSTDLPKLKTHAVYANNGFAASFPEVVRDYVQAQLTLHRQISDNPASVSDAAVRWLEADPALIPETIQAYTSINAWDADGGLTAEAVAYSLDFFVRTSGLADSLVPEKLADLGFLHQVLSRMQP